MPRRPRSLSALALVASTAFAQDPDALLREGLALRQQGDDRGALRAFASAYAMRPEPRAAAQLGLTHQALGQWLEAERLLLSALRAADDPWIVRHRTALAAASDVVARRLGTLELQGPAGATVEVDGRPAGRLPLATPLRIVAGVLTVRVAVDGATPLIRRVVLEPGTFGREVFEPPPAPTPSPPPSPAPPPSLPIAPARVVFRTVRRSDAATTALFGVGGAALALGVTALVARELAALNFNNVCPSAGAGPCASLSDQAGGWGATAAVALPLAAIVTGIGVWRAVAR